MEESPHKILIVDDVPANLRLLTSILKDGGYMILEAENGLDAIKLAEEQKPHLVLLDVMMPGIDGFETCIQLKNNPETASIAVIFISAKNTVTDKVRGLELGAVDFISKPFHKTEVVARVRTHLELEIARRKLRQSEINHQTLIENVKDGIFLWNYDGIIFANSAFAQMLDRDTGDDIRGAQLDDILSPEEVSGAEDMMSTILLNRESGDSVENTFKMLRSSGEIVITSCFSCFVSFSEKPCVLVTVRDMTERLSLERQLNQAQKVEALGLLTSGIAHDFNNILALINGYTELCMMEVDENSSIHEKMKIVMDAGKSAISLTKGLLSFGKRKNMEPKPIDIVEELRRVYGFLQRGLPKNIEFILGVPNEQISAFLDTGQFEQVIVNLCLNARDAMKNGGTLKIFLEKMDITKLPLHAPEGAKPGPYLVINVSDNGIGIPDEILDNIFNPFFTTKKQGTGLGLAMVERITRNHKGWVDYETKLDRGTVFRLYIPQLLEPNKDQLSSTNYLHEKHSSLKKILVLDDDEIQTSMIQHFLEKEGYKVFPTHSAKAALKILEKNHKQIGMAILDNIMPGMSGLECSKVIQERWPDIRIMIITGAGEIAMADKKLLRKPFTAMDLLQALDELAFQ